MLHLTFVTVLILMRRENSQLGRCYIDCIVYMQDTMYYMWSTRM